MTRRDRCYVLGRRIARASSKEAAIAWFILAMKLELLGELDVPKFNDLTNVIQEAYLESRACDKEPEQPGSDYERHTKSGRRSRARAGVLPKEIPGRGPNDRPAERNV